VRCELYFDGASIGNPGPAGYGYVIRCGESVYKGSGYIGETTNNVAEYTGLIEGLRRCLELGCRELVIVSEGSSGSSGASTGSGARGSSPFTGPPWNLWAGSVRWRSST